MHRMCMRPLVFITFLSNSFPLLDSLSVLPSYLARRFYLSYSSRARFYDILESPFSFSRGANASYFPVVASFVVSFDYRHETRRLFLETPVRVFLFHLLNVCGTRVSTASLSQIIAAGIFFDLIRPARPDLIFRDLDRMYYDICMYVHITAVTLGRFRDVREMLIENHSKCRRKCFSRMPKIYSQAGEF